MAISIPDELVENIRQSVNIVDVVSPYVALKKQGRNLFGRCPWHEERTPSFSVNEEKQIFHCFSCGRGGNAFTFLMEKEELSFPQAVAKVADLTGIALDTAYTATQDEKVQIPQRQRDLLALYEEATKFYHYLLVNAASGETALQYLHQRGLDDNTIDAYMLGYAPEEDALYNYFNEKKIDYQLMRESELFIVWDDGSLHDRFVDRVLFTIRNKGGAPIAFSGRRMSSDDTIAKYMNSPESVLFDKSEELFNFDLAKTTIKKSKVVILFEGFMDVIAAFQAGIHNGVASMGTSLTKAQVRRLNQNAEEIHVAYDSDAAGQAATHRAIELIDQNSSLKTKIIHIPDNQDPDEYLRSQGIDAFQEVLTRNLEDPVAFNLNYLRQDFDLSNQGDIFNYLEQVLPTLAQVKEPLVRQTFVQQLATEFNVSSSGLEEQLRSLMLQKQVIKRGPESYIEPEQVIVDRPTLFERPALSRVEQAEQILLTWMLKRQDAWLKVTSSSDFHFVDVIYETLFLLADGFKQKKQIQEIKDWAEFMDFVKEPELVRVLSQLNQIDDALMQDLEQVDEYVSVLLNQAPLEEKIKQKQRELLEAKQVHNEVLATQLSFEVLTLLREKQAKQ
ncbi:DNA primase [Weissella coleopterorum]|uniref:DNA primase n=1 Tax=Weissella coleopterorum TaxID=2714949 RepID=A0A6G8B1U4_9LACO|nr:DNA primase [Weissella coleopterorum]QIL51284.1 DNA primase [Weissella coleopterorum]